MVPPLLLQPLVENAIYHGIAPRLEGGKLTIEAECEGSRLFCESAITVQVSEPTDAEWGLPTPPSAFGCSRAVSIRRSSVPPTATVR